MAIAGKVAITLSTENGGAWSADVTYDRLVAVKHNNNLYISRKTVANVEPPNDEFWFLALEGFGGDDVQALIDRMNELSDLIQAIIDGTTQIGNAKTLDGHGADEFLQTSGGTLESQYNVALILKNIGALWSLLKHEDTTGVLGHLGFSEKNKPIFVNNDATDYHELLHTGNKPTGTYTGNGSTAERVINTGGVGSILAVWGGGAIIFLTASGIMGATNNQTIDYTLGKWVNGNYIMNTDNVLLNRSGIVYSWAVL